MRIDLIRSITALLALTCLLTGCQPLPVQTSTEAAFAISPFNSPVATVPPVATAAPTPEPTVIPTPTPRPRPALSATLDTGEPSVLELVPLGLGATWVYSVTLNVSGDEGNAPLHWTSVLTETITDVQRVHSAWVFRSETTGQPLVDNPPHELVQFYVPLGGRLYVLAESLDPLELIQTGGEGFEGERIVTWPLAVGQTWTDPNLAADEGPLYYWLVEAEEEVSTAAGNFTGCYRIVFRGETDDATSWFCPGVGLTRYQYRDPTTGHDERWELLARQPGKAPVE